LSVERNLSEKKESRRKEEQKKPKLHKVSQSYHNSVSFSLYFRGIGPLNVLALFVNILGLHTGSGARAYGTEVSHGSVTIDRGAFLLGWCWPPKIDPMLNVMESVS
jgi:hypothetical protein